ncbi:hypothetical protein [Halobellus captivus]|uniref:hypothetical protein n=1 Tax=Halobellus captivus TaxID=2592614 RepID=UPI00119E8281|nr:hypothetical protein [Halobellus captivus]
MRRRAFVFGTVPLCTGISGCLGLFSDPSMLSLTVFNHTESQYTIEVTFLASDENSSRREARVFSERIDVEPDDQTVREDVAEVQPYIIEYGLYKNNSTLTDQDHVHYYPGEEDESGSLAFNINSSGDLTRR